MRRRGFIAASLVATCCAGLAPAGAQTDPNSDPEVVKARTVLEQAQAEARAAAEKVERTRQQRSDIEAEITAAQAQITEIQAQIPVLQAQQAALRAKLTERAVALYRNASPVGPRTFSLVPSLTELRRQRLADAAAKQDQTTKDQLRSTEAQLATLKSELDARQAQLGDQRAQLDQLAAQLQAQQAEVDKRVANANAALERAKTLGALRARGEPIQGSAVLTAAQLASWWRTQGYSFRVPGTTIDELAQIFIEEGEAEGVRGDFAFAQSIIETGGFSAAPRNNFAGLGWCDSCSHGTDFPTARDGVRAQIQHLLNYADATSRAAGLHHPPSPYWYGSDPGDAARRFNTFFAKGWAPTWNDMGSGNWATDRNYSTKVIGVYQKMVAFAQSV